MKFSSMSLVKQLMLLLVGAVFISQSVILVIFATKVDERSQIFRTSDIAKVLTRVQLEMQRTEDFSSIRTLPESLGFTDLVYAIETEPLQQVMGDGVDWRPISVNDIEGRFIRYNGDIGIHWEFWFTDDWQECLRPLTPANVDKSCPFMLYEFPLTQGYWLIITENSGPMESVILAPVTLGAIISLIIISAGIYWLVRRMTLPLRQLSLAAKRFGRGEKNQQLVVRGSSELRESITAFNEMQERINRFVSDRTKMLAAISHDLRTPITSLRLRTEFIADESLRLKMERTLSDMQQMVESCLAFTKEESSDETHSEFDLVTLLTELADDSSYIDFYRDVDHCCYNGQRIALTRALVNLLDNAVKYGEHADINLSVEGEWVCIRITDQGPGIPEDKLQEVFEPFVRLDQSRHTEGASVGLGLSISRSIIHKHAGHLQLKNLSPGLFVEIRLPLH